MLAKARANNENIYIEVISVGSIGASSCSKVCEVGRELLGLAVGHGDDIKIRIFRLRPICLLEQKWKEKQIRFVLGCYNMIAKLAGLFTLPSQALRYLFIPISPLPVTIVSHPHDRFKYILTTENTSAISIRLTRLMEPLPLSYPLL